MTERPKCPFPDAGDHRSDSNILSGLSLCGISGDVMVAISFCAPWRKTHSDFFKCPYFPRCQFYSVAFGHCSWKLNKLPTCIWNPFLNLKENNQTG